MAFAEMYFDESEDKSHQLLCVAGYLFREENRALLEAQWGAVLARENLPYFRMVDCAHGTGVFDGISKEKRGEIEVELFDILKRYLEVGISITFDLRFAHLCPSAKYHGMPIVEPYTLCAYMCMMQGRKWASDTGFDGQISYYFEAGHKHQSQADRMMSAVFDVPDLRSHYRYKRHDFLRKEQAIPLQCGDILAWQWSKAIKDMRVKKKVTRADLNSLLTEPHFTIHFNEESLTEFRAVVNKSNETIEMRRLYRTLWKYGAYGIDIVRAVLHVNEIGTEGIGGPYLSEWMRV